MNENAELIDYEEATQSMKAEGMTIEKGEFPVTVDYNEQIEKRLKASGCDYEYFDYHCYPIHSQFLGKKMNVKLLLVGFNDWVETAEAIIKLARHGLRPANATELVEFVVKYPHIIDKFAAIPAVGSITGDLFVPFARLNKMNSERELWSDDFQRGWTDRCRFLAVRDQNAHLLMNKGAVMGGIALTIGRQLRDNCCTTFTGVFKDGRTITIKPKRADVRKKVKAIKNWWRENLISDEGKELLSKEDLSKLGLSEQTGEKKFEGEHDDIDESNPAQKVNEILRKVFGRGTKGNMSERPVILNVDDAYRETDSLDCIVKTNFVFTCVIGRFTATDGSSLSLYPSSILRRKRRKQAKKYCELYQKHFKKRPIVEFE